MSENLFERPFQREIIYTIKYWLLFIDHKNLDFKRYEVQSKTILSSNKNSLLKIRDKVSLNGFASSWKLEALKCISIMQLRGTSVGWIRPKCHRLKIGKNSKRFLLNRWVTLCKQIDFLKGYISNPSDWIGERKMTHFEYFIVYFVKIARGKISKLLTI